jgi:flavin-dependent dehydrogenase
VAQAELHPPGRITAASVFLATGKHDLRGWPRQPKRTAGSIGLKTYLQLCPAQGSELADAVELILFPGGYAGLQHVENRRAVLCALVSPECLRETGASDRAMGVAGLSPHLRRRLEGARPLLPRALAVAGLPYGHLCAEAPEKLVYRLGDQAAVIPSLTGDGVAIALASGILAAESWLRGESAEEFQTRFASLLRPPMRRASLVHAASRSTRLQPTLALACSGFPWLLRHAARTTRIASTMTAVEERSSRVASPGCVPQKREAEGDHAAPCATAG